MVWAGLKIHMALSRFRNSLGRLCKELTDRITNFAFPAPLEFGNDGAEGTSEQLVRADHVHALPDVPADTFDNLLNETLLFHEFIETTALSNPDFNTTGTITNGGRDVLGKTGGFGTVDAEAAASSHSSVFFTNESVADWNDDEFLKRRFRTIEMRARPVLTSANLSNIAFCAGTIKTSTTGTITTTVAGDGVLEGIYFLLDNGGTPGSTYKCRVTNSGVTTEVDSGVTPTASGSDQAFENFRIDITEVNTETPTFRVVFTLNGTVVATIDEIGLTGDTAGIGVFLQNKDGSNTRTSVIDYLFTLGKRVVTV